MAELAYCVPAGIPHSTFLSWEPSDQDKALAFAERKRATCSGCGTRAAEWQADKFAYVAAAERCVGCELLETERANVPPGEKGVRVNLVRRRGN